MGDNRSTVVRIMPVLWFFVIAITAAFGYIAGSYHYQIEAAIGPVFGYKAHSGEIDLSSVQQTYNKLAANYDGKLDTDLLIEGASRGLVDAADDAYTVYMSASESADFDKLRSGEIGSGIGAEIGIRNDKVTIIRVLANNAAINAGLLANDTIFSINDQSTSGWTVTKAVDQIKGEEGTTVKLGIERNGETKDYVVTRKTINNPSVESSISDDIGTLTITRFDEETGNLARIAAQDFKKRRVKAVILDLRDNPGGTVPAAVDVAGLWLNNAVVVTERTGGLVRDTLRTGNSALLSSVKTVVLINENSASASEIVAGALQDSKTAKLVGGNTFGKGVVQQLISLDGGAMLKVTIASWYTPNGNNVSKSGIKPDVAIAITQDDVNAGVDPQLNAAKKLLGL